MLSNIDQQTHGGDGERKLRLNNHHMIIVKKSVWANNSVGTVQKEAKFKITTTTNLFYSSFCFIIFLLFYAKVSCQTVIDYFIAYITLSRQHSIWESILYIYDTILLHRHDGKWECCEWDVNILDTISDTAGQLIANMWVLHNIQLTLKWCCNLARIYACAHCTLIIIVLSRSLVIVCLKWQLLHIALLAVWWAP